MSAATLGPERNRVDGRLKVTGAAKYAVEFEIPKCATGWMVESNIAKGKITAVDTKAALALPGVLAVLTHQNAPKLKAPPKGKERNMAGGIRNEDRFPLSDAVVHYAGQYVALVIAETIEQARHGASLVRVTYAAEKPILTMEAGRDAAKKPKKNRDENVQLNKGEAEQALRNAQLVKIEETYITPTETHNPIEMSGTIAVWEGDAKLTVYDATQFVKGVQNILAESFGLEVENVRVICPYVGGAFGCKGAVWPHVLLAAMGAKAAGVPVKVHISRQYMFTGTGYRTPTRQRIALAATRDGKLQAMQHVSETLTSTVGQFTETCGARSTALMYHSPAIRVEEVVYPINVSTPTFMRAPGECPGMYALECAMDELAYALKVDPVELRVTNHADNHPGKEVPFSAKFLKECYSLGAEKFGWAKRNPQPGSMSDGDMLVGWGVATATYPAHKMTAAAKVQLRVDGTATVQCATHDLGTGAYTAFTQISSEQLGLPFENITFQLGSSDYPFGPVAGGSNSTGTVGTAIHEAAVLLHKSLAEIAVKDSASPLYNQNVDDIAMTAPGRLGLKKDTAKSDGFSEILKRAGRDSIEVQTKEPKSEPDKTRAFQSFGAHFCEVKVDPLLPRVQVTRVVSVMNCGRIVVAKQARSQIIGGVVMGIGMALTEETAYDPGTGLPATRNLADYHVPTNADIPAIEVHFVGEPDLAFNPIGARGMGEIGITGIAAAVANAVFHATGKRVRDLPITPDKLIFMKELREIVRLAATHPNESLALATLVCSTGSSYRRPGARMLVTSSGATAGSLSAGCLEEEVAAVAREVIASGQARLMQFDTRRRFGCHGSIEIFVEKITRHWLDEIAQHLEVRRTFSITTKFDDNEFVQAIEPTLRLLLIGDGPDVAALAAQAQLLGWETAVMESITQCEVDARTAVVVATHNYGRDCAALRYLLPRGLRYVGVIGPRRRREELLVDVLDSGTAMQSALFAPAGLDLGAETPEEIALSIVSEIQQVFAGGTGESLRDSKLPIHHERSGNRPRSRSVITLRQPETTR